MSLAVRWYGGARQTRGRRDEKRGEQRVGYRDLRRGGGGHGDVCGGGKLVQARKKPCDRGSIFSNACKHQSCSQTKGHWGQAWTGRRYPMLQMRDAVLCEPTTRFLHEVSGILPFGRGLPKIPRSPHMHDTTVTVQLHITPRKTCKSLTSFWTPD